MRLDLVRVGCEQFSGYVNVPADSPYLEGLRQALPERLALGHYSRSRVRHNIIVGRVTLDEGEDEFTYSFTYGTQGSPSLGSRGEVFDAVDLLQSAAAEHSNAHVTALFEVSAREYDLKMSLPLPMFAPGAFPFDEIRGYRAVKTDGDEVRWSAVVDQPILNEDRQISVSIDTHDEGAVPSFAGLLAHSAKIRDELVIQRMPNDD